MANMERTSFGIVIWGTGLQRHWHPRLNFSNHLGRVSWYGRMYLTGPPPWRFLWEAPRLSSALQKECLTEVYIIFGGLCNHLNYLNFTLILLFL